MQNKKRLNKVLMNLYSKNANIKHKKIIKKIIIFLLLITSSFSILYTLYKLLFCIAEKASPFPFSSKYKVMKLKTEYFSIKKIEKTFDKVIIESMQYNK